MTLLTDEEIEKIWYEWQAGPRPSRVTIYAEMVAKTQLKKVVEWLETKGHPERDEGSGDFYWEFDFIIKGHEWEALLKEIK